MDDSPDKPAPTLLLEGVSNLSKKMRTWPRSWRRALPLLESAKQVHELAALVAKETG
jgi:hypothetical protein